MLIVRQVSNFADFATNNIKYVVFFDLNQLSEFVPNWGHVSKVYLVWDNGRICPTSNEVFRFWNKMEVGMII